MRILNEDFNLLNIKTVYTSIDSCVKKPNTNYFFCFLVHSRIVPKSLLVRYPTPNKVPGITFGRSYIRTHDVDRSLHIPVLLLIIDIGIDYYQYISGTWYVPQQ